MKKILQSLLISVTILFATFCGAAEKDVATNVGNTLKPQVTGFHAITAKGVFDFNVTVGQPQNIIISGDSQLLNKLQIEVKDGVLFIYYPKDFSIKSTNVPVITMTTPQLTAFTAEGNNKISISQLKNAVFALNSHGNQKIILNGTADTFTIDIMGDAKLDAKDFAVKKALLNAQGNSDIKLNVLDELHTRTMGNTSVKVYGHPKIVTTSMIGNGHVEAVAH